MIKRIVIVLIAILVVFLGRGLFFYSGFYSAPPSEMPSYEHIVIPAASSSDFYDVYEPGEGSILFDLSHNNAFDIEELDVLMSRLIARGLSIDFLSEEDNLKEKLLGIKEEEEEGDEEEGDEEEASDGEIETADAYIIVCPQEEFSTKERETVDQFISNGGKLLLIADPTRSSKINSISLKFGLVFEPGYLYNMKENDANYRNIFVAEFKGGKITEELEKIALYTAGAITSADGGIAFVDQNTFSSVIETRQRLSPIALTRGSKVLAVYDLTFMTEPYNGILGNNQLISNIADWLSSPTEEEKEEQEEGVKSTDEG